MKIPLFDVDGTLIKGFVGVHGQAMNEAFSKVFHIPASYDEINVQGMIDPQIIAEIAKIHQVSETEILHLMPKAFEVMREYISAHKHTAVYQILPGVKELFLALKENNVPIGLLTGNIEEAPEMKLGNLWKFIDFGAYGPEATSLKRVELVGIAQKKASDFLQRNVALNELVIVGDTPKDIACAKEGRILSIGVATGIYSTDELKNAGANLVVGSLEEKEPILAFLE